MSDGPVESNRVNIDRPAAVGWFSLRLLAATGIRALVNSLIGAQTGRRELLAALDNGPSSKVPFSKKEEKSETCEAVWVDYVADIGDGFNATHSVAWLIGRDYLFFKEPGEPVAQPALEKPDAEPAADSGPPGSTALPRADLLIFGGDQVYPYATQTNYQSRTYQPYYAARPWGSPDPQASEEEGGRSLFAIPGNHDWYDGLISFVRLFCQSNPKRWIGALYVQQPRSYFSYKLPHGWWIWGVDVASEDDIDPPQLAYFKAQALQMDPDDRVVLCTAKPAWVDCIDQRDANGNLEPLPEAWSKLATIAKLANKGGVPVFLSGDLHHYTRHEGTDGKQYITCGGGGAFTLGTTIQPERLRIDEAQTALRKCAYPSIEESRGLRAGALAMLVRHKLFCAVLGIIMLYLVWLFHASSRLLPSAIRSEGASLPFLPALRSGLDTGLAQFVTILTNFPGTMTVFALILVGFCGFASSGAERGGARWKSLLLGFFHFLAQLGAATIVAVVVDLALARIGGGPPMSGLWRDVLFPPIAVVFTTILCGLVFGAYLFLANATFGWHEQEVFSSQAIQDWKCFLRMKIDKDGLTIYPIGLRKVATTWSRTLPAPSTSNPTAMQRAVTRIFGADTFDVPKGTTHLYVPVGPLEPHLIEEPINIVRAAKVEEVTGRTGSVTKVAEVTTT
ncbi:hypothetical protein N185_16480 [Sinorhizobium sp. GW3]|nr:hypothetical protein N185_16480 [Sinorhizobium sp. GW3]